MSRLRIYPEDRPDAPEAEHSDGAAIAAALATIGVRFERWPTDPAITAATDADAVLAAYAPQLDRLKAAGGYRSCDCVGLTPDHPEREAMRAKFLDEHTHAEDEVRFFVDGRGLFTLHVDGRVHEVLCERGDLIGVPAGTRHWFDMGPAPHFLAIRIFSSTEGWAADFTGTDIARRFPRLEA